MFCKNLVFKILKGATQSNFRHGIILSFWIAAAAILLHSWEASKVIFETRKFQRAVAANESSNDRISGSIEQHTAHTFYKLASDENQALSTPTKLLGIYVLGIDLGLGRKIKQIHQDFGMKHLFTPSGLQVTPLVYLFTKILPKKFLSYMLLIFYWLSILFWKNSEFAALQRMLLFHGLNLFSWKNLKTPTEIAFLVTFLIDFFKGTYDLSPMSYWLSFIFLGTIYLVRPKFLFYHFIVLQSFISILFDQRFSFLHQIMGSIFSLLSVPLFFISLPIFLYANTFYYQYIVHPLIDGFYISLNIFSNWIPVNFFFRPSLDLVLLLFFLPRMKINFVNLLIAFVFPVSLLN
ncbi:MAG: hypothetical protein QE271_09700 [Bacteriovoracaceae bacterium]|nr:hypothetical protein [Bacteriovoracaceae bacterium]